MTAVSGAGASFRHEGFLRYARYRWAKAALLLCALAGAGYAATDATGEPMGGTPFGYASGTVGAGLIVWLTLLGIRKRAITPGRWSLRGWTSAHVWLGLALAVVATLHSGFRFDWNVHTLAWALMLAVIASGLVGVLAYTALPAALSANRGELTGTRMVADLAQLDRQLADAALPLPDDAAALVRQASAEDPLADGLVRRLRGVGRAGATARARAALEAGPVLPLLDRRLALVAQLRRHLHLRALLEAWLFVHVPLTIALLAALAAHIVAELWFW